MDYIIRNDPVLNYFIRDAKIDWFNDHQIELRCAAILIALNRHLDIFINNNINRLITA